MSVYSHDALSIAPTSLVTASNLFFRRGADISESPTVASAAQLFCAVGNPMALLASRAFFSSGPTPGRAFSYHGSPFFFSLPEKRLRWDLNPGLLARL